MNIEHFTEKAREAISDAAQVARQYNHNQVEVEHLLAALLAQEGGVVQQVIAKVGARPLKRVIQREVENRIARGILDGTIRDGDTVEIDAKDGKLVMEPVRAQEQEAAHAH